MDTINKYIIEHYADYDNEEITMTLNISIYQLRRLAAKLGVKKSSEYLKVKMEKTREAQKKHFKNRIPSYTPSIEQWQILLGSLLGDGTLSKGTRSLNYAYKEHFGVEQLEYRQWKERKLSDLGLHITKSNHLYSYSHPIFTTLYSDFFKDSVKKIPVNLLPIMTHPIFLATLYMDDGSLLLSPRITAKKVIIHPSIAIYSQSFTKKENEILNNHINNTFKTNFVLNKRPDGHGYILKLHKEKEVRFFLELIQNYTNEIPSMFYKTNLQHRFTMELKKWKDKYPDKEIMLSSSERNKPYSKEEIDLIRILRRSGYTWERISHELSRTYWSVIYKAKEVGLISKGT